MKRIFALAMVGSLATGACGRGVLSVTTPTDTSAGTFAVAAGPSVGGMIESIEKPTRGIGGALIEITLGPNAGKSTLSDDAGSFGLLGLAAGTMRLQVSKSGYQSWTSKNRRRSLNAAAETQRGERFYSVCCG